MKKAQQTMWTFLLIVAVAAIAAGFFFVYQAGYKKSLDAQDKRIGEIWFCLDSCIFADSPMEVVSINNDTADFRFKPGYPRAETVTTCREQCDHTLSEQ